MSRRLDDAVVAGEVARVVERDRPGGAVLHDPQPAVREQALQEHRVVDDPERPAELAAVSLIVLKQCGQAVTIVRSPIP